MNYLILIVILIIIIIVCFPSKESSKEPFYEQPLYPSIHKYHKDSYKYGLHGNKKHTYTTYLNYAIPLINHIIL